MSSDVCAQRQRARNAYAVGVDGKVVAVDLHAAAGQEVERARGGRAGVRAGVARQFGPLLCQDVAEVEPGELALVDEKWSSRSAWVVGQFQVSSRSADGEIGRRNRRSPRFDQADAFALRPYNLKRIPPTWSYSRALVASITPSLNVWKCSTIQHCRVALSRT
jgi:hypothetical protein